MQNLILKILTIFLITTSISFAQRSKQGRARVPLNPEQRTERALEQMVLQLELNDEQKEAFRESYLKFYTQLDEQRKLERSKVDEKRKELASQRDESLKNVLNEEQLNKYTVMLDIQEKRQESRKKRGENRPNRGR